MLTGKAQENPGSDIEDYDLEDETGYKSQPDLDEPEEKTEGETSIVKPKKAKKKGFESLDLEDNLLRAIKLKGYKVPTAIQKKVIPLFLEGRDVIASARTGSGKTAAFLIPLIARQQKHSTKFGSRALIMLPTRELALQTASNLKALIKFYDIRYSVIVGGHGYEGQFESLASNPDIIIATPGRLMQLLEETKYSQKSCEFLIFDEADSLFEMGFAQQIRTILTFVSVNRQTFMFSATLPQEVSEFAIAGMRDYAFCRLDSDFTLPSNILLHFFICRTTEKIPLLIHLFKTAIDCGTENTIIFTATSYWVDYLTQLLDIFGVKNVGIYGKMDQLARKEQMGKFFRREVSTLIVTDLVARGIDLPFVDNVINLDFPQQTKLFIHRCGRTARAGRPGVAYNQVGSNELPYLQQIRGCLDRPMVNKIPEQEDKFGEDQVFNKKYAYYGKASDENLQTITAIMNSYIKDDLELQELKEVSEKSMGKFSKTRGTAVVDKEYKSSLDLHTLHPLFAKKKDEKMIEAENLLSRVTGYKPKKSYMELKYYKERVGENKQKFSTMINKMKSEVTSIQEKKELMKRLRDFRQERKDVEDKLDQEIVDLNKEDKALTDEEEKIGQESEDEYQIEIPEGFEKDDYLLGRKNPGDKTNDKKLKKKFKTSETDFRSKKLFISHDANAEAMKEFEDEDKIGHADLNTMYLNNDEGQDVQIRKKMQWNKVTRKYVQIQVNARGEQINGGRAHEACKVTNVAGNKYKSWTKKNMIGFQRIGEEEDSKNTNRARNMFGDRKKTSYRSESSYNYKGVYEASKKIKKPSTFNKKLKSVSKDGAVVSELKDYGTILKKKKKDKNMNLLQMDKNKRTVLLEKQKKAKKGATAKFKKGSVFNKLDDGGKKKGSLKKSSSKKITKQSGGGKNSSQARKGNTKPGKK